jgi:site-specific DNA-methyltransferase (adenine-specific)
MANLKGCMSNKSDEWGTPRELFKELNYRYGFDLDVAASCSNHLLENYYTKEDNALIEDWGSSKIGRRSRAFMNPPFSQLKLFCEKAYREVEAGHCIFVVALLPARTDTHAFHDYIYGKAQIQFLRGRLRFEGAPGPAPFPSMVVTWGMGI